MEAQTRGVRLVALVFACLLAACGGPAEAPAQAAAAGAPAQAAAGAPAQAEALAGAPAVNQQSPDDTPTCPPDQQAAGSGAFEGDVTLANPSDVAAIAGLAEIRGSLKVLPTFSGALDLPNLNHIGGDLHVEGTPGPPGLPNQLTSLRLPNLERIDGQLWIYHAWNLAELDLHSLESITGQLFVMRNLSLEMARLDALTEVGGGVTFSAQTSLPSCATEAVTALAGVPLMNGSADIDCHCESPCGYPRASCD